MPTEQQIIQAIRCKRSHEHSAEKLGIPVEEFVRLKNEVIEKYGRANIFLGLIEDNLEVTEYIQELEGKIIESFNLDNGTGSYTGLISDRPLSPEEIEVKYKIDKSKWRLSSYWNKEQPSGKFLVSANITQQRSAPIDLPLIIKDVLQSLDFSYEPHKVKDINKSFSDKTCAILSLQDIHVGKKTITPFDIEESVKNCVQTLILRSYHSCHLDRIYFVLGGDLVNMDTYTGTTTSGTLVENSMDAYDAYKMAFQLMFWCVNYLKQFCNKLEVIYIPGNHSRLTEAHIAYSLSQCIQDPDIIWDIEYAERKVKIYGDNMFCFEHGDFDTKKSPLVFATEFAPIWGATKNRTLYTGHYHKRKRIEYITEDEVNGFSIKILPSLTETDMYHYSNKWTGNKRGGIIELYSLHKGQIGNFSHYE